MDLVGLAQDLEALLNRNVDIVTGASLHDAIREQVLAESPAPVKDQRVHLDHIRDAIDDISSYAAVGRDAFMAERMRQDAVIRKLEIISEAVKQLSDETRQHRPGCATA